MGEYRRKLRSGKHLAEPEESKSNEDKKEDVLDKELESPQTPPTQSIASYFPPSPFGRKRFQAYGDRFIPSRDRNLARDYQLLDNTSNLSKKNSEGSSSDTASNGRGSRRLGSYIRAELLEDESALDEYISTDPSRTPRRLLNYNTTISPSSSSNTNSILNSHPHSIIPMDNHSTSNHHHYHTSSRYSPEVPNYHRDSILPNLSPSPTLPNHHQQQHHHHTSVESIFDSPSALKYQTSPISEVGRRILSSSDRFPRQINTTAIKILDAPDLQDDFYLNLVDWGPNDCLAVGLGTCVYLWDANTSRVTKLCDFLTDSVTSVNWSQAGSLLAIGLNSGRAFLYDTDAQKKIRSWSTHKSRIGSIAWKSNILSTGGKDYFIYHHDVRSPENYFRKLVGHKQEVCGLKWNEDGKMLASGGNDNNLIIWDSHENAISYRFTQHKAAVKAISWNPHRRGILVSGGGTADKTIKFWNTMNGSMTSSYDTGSQVCNIVWSKKTDDIVSTHGYTNNSNGSPNQVVVWRADKMQQLASLTGHTSRVLYVAMSNDGNTVVTGAGDETLRFWDLFSSVESVRNDNEDRHSCIR